MLLECGVWAHYGHPEWPDPHQLWVKTQRGGLLIRRGIAPSWPQSGRELAPPNMASEVVLGELQQNGKDEMVQRWGEVRSCRG